MSFWSTEKLQLRLPSLIQVFDAKRIKHGAYELGLGPEVVISGSPTKQLLEEQEQIEIPAGQFAHLLTEETVEVPNDALALISIKTSVKKTGLINVSGFHVDSGFKGRLIFSVYNAGVRSVVLGRQTPTFLIWFADLDRETKFPYEGPHLGQSQLSTADTITLQGSTASPPALATRLEALEARVSRWFGAIRWVLLTLLAATIGIAAKQYVDSPNRKQESPAVVDSAVAGSRRDTSTAPAGGSPENATRETR